jgi:hypothetical protein
MGRSTRAVLMTYVRNVFHYAFVHRRRAGVQMPDETTPPGRSKEFWKHPLLVGIVGPIVAGVILFLHRASSRDRRHDLPE